MEINQRSQSISSRSQSWRLAADKDRECLLNEINSGGSHAIGQPASPSGDKPKTELDSMDTKYATALGRTPSQQLVSPQTNRIPTTAMQGTREGPDQASSGSK